MTNVMLHFQSSFRKPPAHCELRFPLASAYIQTPLTARGITTVCTYCIYYTEYIAPNGIKQSHLQFRKPLLPYDIFWLDRDYWRWKLLNEELHNTVHVFKTKGENMLPRKSPCRITVPVLINKFPAFLQKPKVHRRIHCTSPENPILSKMNPVHGAVTWSFKNRINITIRPTPRIFKKTYPYSFSHLNFAGIPTAPNACYRPCQTTFEV